MRGPDNTEDFVPLKERIAQYYRKEREAITRGREEREKWLKEKRALADGSDHSRDSLK